jgi:predicted glutamine amidotransferase
MLRGVDGTGFYQATLDQDKVKSFVFEKTELNANTFVNDLEYRKSKLLDDIHVDFIMGHTRWATIGDVTAKNSHPFDLTNIVAAHNGTLKEWKYFSKNKTDSELMFEEVNKKDLKTVLVELDPQSAYAITLWDKRTHLFTFVRNEHRTLSFALSDDRDVLYYHSEQGALRYILGRNGIKAQYETFKPHRMCSVHPMDIKAKKLAMWDIEDAEPKPSVIFRGWDEPWYKSSKKVFNNNNNNNNPPKAVVKHIHTPRKLTENCSECKRVMYPIDIHQGLNVKDQYLCRQCITKNPQHDLVKKVLN